MRNVAKELQRWSAKHIGHIKSQLRVAREVVLWLQKEMKLQCLGLASLERTMARQRARIRELKEGDANTRYFHLKARCRHRRKQIISIQAGDITAFDQDDIAQVLHDHFSAVMGSEEPRETTIDFSALDIPVVDLSELTTPFSEMEVQAVINDLPSDRAPGPDGFTGAFYKSAWPVIKGDVM